MRSRGPDADETLGAETGGTRREKGEEGGCDCGGTQIGDFAASLVGDRGGLRAVTKRTAGAEASTSLVASGLIDCQLLSSGDCATG
jgi:hypothetical protein